MTRRALTRVLLSLLLLITQQFAFAHAMSHLASARAYAAQPREASETAKALAQDQTCNQCLAFAQLATPLAGAPCQAPPPALSTDAPAVRAHVCMAAANDCPFDSRAPPA